MSCGHDIFTDGKTDMGKINLSNTFNMFVKSTENFLEAFEKKRFSSKNEEQMKINMGLGYSDKTSFFELKFFSMASKNFSVDFTNMFDLSEMSA